MHADSGDRADTPAVLIGVGASAGGVEALQAFVAALPADLDAAVLVVLHVSPTATSVLAQILNRAGPLSAETAVDGAPLRAGRVYVAPPDRHVLVEDGAVRLSHGPRENGHRPAVDFLFRSLAAHGGRAAGVILSGTRDDGALGLAQIKLAGGAAFVQDPDEAAYDGMVRNAIAHVDVDAVLPVAALAAALGEPSDPDHDMTDATSATETSSTRYTCPDCGGHLHREQEGDLVSYACEVGHRYSPESLDGEQATAVESALWTAARMLGDRRAFLAEMADRASERGRARSAERLREQADEARRAADAVRELVERGGVPGVGGTEAVA